MSVKRLLGAAALAFGLAVASAGGAQDDVLKHRIDNPEKDVWATQGKEQTTKVVKSAGVPGDYAMQVKVKAPGRNPWDVAAQSPISGAIKKDDVVLFAVWLRAADGPGEVNLRVQQSDAPYQAIAETALTLKPEWTMVYVSGRSPLELAPGKASVAVHLAKAKQTVEIGPSMVLDFGPTYDMAKLPKNAG